MGRIFLLLTAFLPVTVLVSSAPWAETELEATIFSFDGKDFVRPNAAMIVKGQSAPDTKLDQGGPAYEA